MRLVTSCPQCATIFVVRPEQLAAQKGKVRCGQCQQVFNALDSLQEPANTVIADESIQHIDTATPAMVDTPTEEIDASEADQSNQVNQAPATVEQATQQSESGEDVKVEADAQPKLKEVISELLVPIDLSTDKSMPESKAESAARPANRTGKRTQPRALPEVEIEGKLQQARRRRVNRISLILLCLILALAAALQSIYFLRTPITTYWPVLKPDFVAACKFLGCTVELAANADLLTVDDSDLHEDPELPGLIRLSTTLINNAAFKQRYPLLELTLTDANESPVLRRTFKPAEYLADAKEANNGLAAGEEVHINLALTVEKMEEQKDVSGYRVYVTY